MADQKTPKNTHFTESVAYIQSLFQEPESRRQIFLRQLFVFAKYGLILTSLSTFLATLWFLVQYDLAGMSASEMGIFIPRRGY